SVIVVEPLAGGLNVAHQYFEQCPGMFRNQFHDAPLLRSCPPNKSGSSVMGKGPAQKLAVVLGKPNATDGFKCPKEGVVQWSVAAELATNQVLIEPKINRRCCG